LEMCVFYERLFHELIFRECNLRMTVLNG